MLAKLLWAILLVELLIVMVIDLKTRKISNRWTILHLFLAPWPYLFSLPHYSLGPEPVIYFALLLGMSMTLFSLGVMGGGDAKFIPSFFLILPALWVRPFFELMMVATLLYAGTFFITNLIIHWRQTLIYLKLRDPLLIKGIFGTKIPYAPTFFLAWMALGWDLFYK